MAFRGSGGRTSRYVVVYLPPSAGDGPTEDGGVYLTSREACRLRDLLTYALREKGAKE